MRVGLFGSRTGRFKKMKKLHQARLDRWNERKQREGLSDYTFRTRHIYCWKPRPAIVIFSPNLKKRQERLTPIHRKRRATRKLRNISRMQRTPAIWVPLSVGAAHCEPMCHYRRRRRVEWKNIEYLLSGNRAI